jgi:predicted DNA repair protein MutK
VAPLLMIGGAFLCYEGVEKLAHKLLPGAHEAAAHRAALAAALADPAADLVALERDKIKGAVRTDFILSAEIIAITLGTVAAAPFVTQVAVLSGTAVLMTVGVYGLVAGIVKLDDGGLALTRRPGEGAWARAQRAFGGLILKAAPLLMKFLSVAGTAAMFLVGGGILVHGIAPLNQAIAQMAQGLPGLLAAVTPTLVDGLLGIVAGAIVLLVVSVGQRIFGAMRSKPA